MERASTNVESYFRDSLASVKYRCKTKNIFYDLTAEQLTAMWDAQKGHCALTGVKMTHHIDRTGHRDTNVAIDRINPGGPYTKNNVQLTCYRANNMKGDLSDAEFRDWARRVLDHPKR